MNEKLKVSEWGNFLLIFSRPIREGKQIQNYDHDAYFNKGPPSFSGPDRQLLLPPLGGVWPRPGSGILVYLPPEQGHPLTPPPPPHTIEWLYPPPFLCFTSSYIVIFRSFRCTIPFPSFNSHPVLLSHSISFQTYLPGPNCFHQLHARTP
jgi:hypothetical protein